MLPAVVSWLIVMNPNPRLAGVIRTLCGDGTAEDGQSSCAFTGPGFADGAARCSSPLPPDVRLSPAYRAALYLPIPAHGARWHTQTSGAHEPRVGLFPWESA